MERKDRECVYEATEKQCNRKYYRQKSGAGTTVDDIVNIGIGIPRWYQDMHESVVCLIW